MDSKAADAKAAKAAETKAARKEKDSGSEPVEAAISVMKRPAAAPPHGAKAHKRKPPYFTVERSRNQLMCRTGLGGPGSSHKIKIEGSEAAAVKRAEAWVAEERIRQGL